MKKIMLIVFVALFVITGCKKDSLGDDNSEPSKSKLVKPIANAGVDQLLKEDEIVNFTSVGSDDSDGSIVGYEWREGTTVLSTTPTFSKSDLSVGIHTITLSVTDNDAEVGSDTMTVEIVSYQSLNIAPKSILKADAGLDKTLKEGEQADFNASESIDTNGHIVSYEWREGSTLLSTSSSFSKSDFSIGKRAITLRVTDNDGNMDSDEIIVKIVSVNEVVPLADAGENQSIPEGEIVNFSAQSLNDINGTLLTYEWRELSALPLNNLSLERQDIFLSNNLSFSKSDFLLGKHTVVLTVRDNHGGVNSDTVIINVIQNTALKANAGKDQVLKIGEKVFFTSARSSGDIVSYEWKEGDKVLSNYPYFQKSDFTVGEHAVTLTIKDNNAEISNDLVMIYISSSKTKFPTADAGVDQLLKEGETVNLSASGSSDSDGSIVGYEWKEGTKLLSQSESFSKSNFSAGEHIITLTVRDNDGTINSDEIIVNIVSMAPNATIWSFDKYTNILEGDIYFISNRGTNYDNGVSYEWMEGSTILYTGLAPFGSSFEKSDFSVGTHTITLVATNRYGVVATDTATVVVKERSPTAYAGLDQYRAYGESVPFNANGSSDLGGEIVGYEWKYEGIVLSNDPSFSKSDFPIGIHTITLTVTDNHGLTETDSFEIEIVKEINQPKNNITHNGIVYNSVRSSTGRVWLDKNLGAQKVCTSQYSKKEEECFGDYYQWGREADGHEKPTSPSTSIKATDVVDINSTFILGTGDWVTDLTDSDGTLRSFNWSKTDGTSVCPVGFRVPTYDELKNDATFINVPNAGYRASNNGIMNYYQCTGPASCVKVYFTRVWSSDASGQEQALALGYGWTLADNYPRASGFSIRCIQD